MLTCELVQCQSDSHGLLFPLDRLDGGGAESLLARRRRQLRLERSLPLRAPVSGDDVHALARRQAEEDVVNVVHVGVELCDDALLQATVLFADDAALDGALLLEAQRELGRVLPQ